MSAQIKWKAGDLFFMPQWPTRIYRIHRKRGTTLYYLGNEYGANPPRGIIRSAHTSSTVSWVHVDRLYSTTPAPGQVTRSGMRSKCEKCNTATNWIIQTGGRSAYWCGCD